jgi:hypothetical protein
MPLVRFTQNIQRHVPCPEQTVRGTTIRAALESYFEAYPRARPYVFDEQGTIRRHMVVFLDGVQAADRTGLSDLVQEQSTIDVMQALSGG